MGRRRATGVVALVAGTVLTATVLDVRPAVAQAQSASVNILPTIPWTATSLMVTAGQPLTITATGTIRFVDRRHYAAPPSGRLPCLAARKMPFFVDPAAPCYSLIGRIGPDGTPFEVGTDFSTTSAPATGELYLGPNDNRFPDNRGTWTATVTGASGPVVAPVSVSPAPPVVVPAVLKTASPTVTTPAPTPRAPLAFTGFGPGVRALGVIGAFLVLLGLALYLIRYLFGSRLRFWTAWLLGR